ncbi:MAG: hypothetical protein WCO04_19665 [Pseudomonadota bacterium]
MTSFYLSEDNRFSVSLAVESLGLQSEVSMSADLCDRICGSITAYLAEVDDRADVSDWEARLRPLAQLLLSDAPSIGLIRTRVAGLPAPLIRQIETRALRLADQVPACATVGSDLFGWAKDAAQSDLIPLLRLCVVEGGAVLDGRNRPSGRPSARHFEPIVFGRGRGMGWLPKLVGGRPADDAEIRLIVHLAVDWHLATGFEPEAGRDGHSAFSGLVHDVFGWIGRSKKAKFSLRAYWAMVADKAGTHPAADQNAGN